MNKYASACHFLNCLLGKCREYDSKRSSTHQYNAQKRLVGCVGNFKKVQNHFFIYKLKLEVNKLHIFEGHD